MNHPAHTEPHRPTTPGLKPMLGALCGLAVSVTSAHAAALSVEGVHVVPHVQSAEMRYRQKPDFSLGARVEVFLRNASPETLVIPSTTDVRARGQTPEELLQADEPAWHDLPSAWGGDPLRLPPGAITAWSWNGKRALWSTNTQADLTVTLADAREADRLAVPIENPSAWLSAVTFRGAATNVQPDTLIFHVANRRVLHLLNWTGNAENEANYLPPVENVTVRLTLPEGRKVRRVSTLIESPLRQKRSGGHLELRLPRVDAYPAVRIELE